MLARSARRGVGRATFGELLSPFSLCSGCSLRLPMPPSWTQRYRAHGTRGIPQRTKTGLKFPSTSYFFLFCQTTPSILVPGSRLLFSVALGHAAIPPTVGSLLLPRNPLGNAFPRNAGTVVCRTRRLTHDAIHTSVRGRRMRIDSKQASRRQLVFEMRSIPRRLTASVIKRIWKAVVTTEEPSRVAP